MRSALPGARPWYPDLRHNFAPVLILGCAAGAVSAVPSSPSFLLWSSLAFAAVAAVCWLLLEVNRWLSVFLAAALILPPLPLPWGDSGVHPSILVAAAGVCSGALSSGWRVRFNLPGVALLAIFAAFLLSVPWAARYSGTAAAAGTLARVGLFGIAVYVFFYCAYGPGRNVPADHLLRLLFWCGFAVCAFAVADFLFQFPPPARFAEQFVWLNSGIYRRAQGPFYESSTLGSFCVFLLAMIGSLRTAAGRPLAIGVFWILAAASTALAALVFSFSRGAMLAALVSGLALLWLRRERLAVPQRAVAFVLLAIPAGLVAFFLLYRVWPEYFLAYTMRLRQTVEFFLAEPNAVLSRRLDSWWFLLDYLRENPALAVLGLGYKTLPYSEHVGASVIADNMYLSLLIETGLPGFCALWFLNLAILLTAYRQARSSDRLAQFCGVWMFSFWCGLMVQMASGDILTYWRVLPAFFLVLSLGARCENPVSRPVR